MDCTVDLFSFWKCATSSSHTHIKLQISP